MRGWEGGERRKGRGGEGRAHLDRRAEDLAEGALAQQRTPCVRVHLEVMREVPPTPLSASNPAPRPASPLFSSLQCMLSVQG